MRGVEREPGRAAVPVEAEADVSIARLRGGRLAGSLGFSPSDQAAVSTAISELARNVLQNAGRGDILIEAIEKDGIPGLRVTVEDRGPGIPDLALAMQDGYSTTGGLGLGLPGAKRLMDEFAISSRVGEGTRVAMVKWRR